jgi:hypothetical protein
VSRSSPGKRRRGKLKPLGRKPSPRNPYVVAAKRLGHRVKPSSKAYRRKGRKAPEAEEIE